MFSGSIQDKKKNTQDLFLTILKTITTADESGGYGRQISAGLSRGADWDYFILLSLYHRVENLIYKGLEGYFSNIPADTVLKLKGYWLQSNTINQRKLTAIKEVLAEFNKLGIEFILIKGLFLSRALYGDINLRGLVCDLDVFVRSQLRFQIEDQLKKQGYVVEEDEEPEGFQWQKDIFREKDNFCIDLHWNLSRHWQRDAVLEEMWKDAHEEYLEGIPYLSLSLEDTLIYLSVHLADGDGYRQLIHICDIARFIHIFKNKIDFEKLLDKARRYHLTNSLYYGLWLSHQNFGSEIGDGILKALKPGLFKRMLVYPFVRRKNYFAETIIRKLVRRYFNFFLFDLVEAKGIKGYLRLIRLILFTPQKSGKLSLSQFTKRLLRPFNWLISEWLKEKKVLHQERSPLKSRILSDKKLLIEYGNPATFHRLSLFFLSL